MPKSTSSPYTAALAHVLALNSVDQARVLSRIKKQLHGAASVDLETLSQKINMPANNQILVFIYHEEI